MPGFDGNGPQGKGPATGRGQGTCRQDEQNRALPTCRRAGKGQGRGMGMNNGRQRNQGNSAMRRRNTTNR